jgi:hypothetical protein
MNGNVFMITIKYNSATYVVISVNYYLCEWLPDKTCKNKYEVTMQKAWLHMLHNTSIK